ncbi:MAG: hypothetical protein U1E98_05100 [Moraxella osloensis]
MLVLIEGAPPPVSRQQFAAMAQLSGRFLDWLRGTATLQRLDAVGHASQDIDASAKPTVCAPCRYSKLRF